MIRIARQFRHTGERRYPGLELLYNGEAGLCSASCATPFGLARQFVPDKLIRLVGRDDGNDLDAVWALALECKQ